MNNQILDNRKADAVFYNGHVISVDAEDTIYEAIAVADNKILALGTTEEMKQLAISNTNLVNLEGRSLIPGIVDSHVHTAVYGMNANTVDLRPSRVSSIDDIKRLIKEEAEKTPKGQWIRGWGYNHMMLDEKRHPNKFDLDEVAPDHPVILTRVCAHISAHNSKSLEVAGITNSSEPVEGGDFERIDGEVTGVMFENSHMEMMRVSMPSTEEFLRGIKTANELLVSEGITSITDSGGYGSPQMDAFQQAVESDIIKIRLNTMIFSFVRNTEFVRDYLDVGIHTGFGDDRLKLGPIKLMIDGSSSGPTAATLEPYTSNPDSTGIMSMEQDEIDEIVMDAHKKGWQITCHAVGDKAITTILDALEKAMKEYPRKDPRHRIEHCAMMNDNLFERIKELGIIPIPQPVFLYEFGDGYMVNYGQERAYRMFPCGSFHKKGILAAGSSDCPITFSNPFLNMYMAANRKTQTGQVINEEECMGIKDILRMFTINGAYASFEEDIKGSLEPGKLADIAILDRNLYETPKEELKDITVDMTMIDGEIVFEK